MEFLNHFWFFQVLMEEKNIILADLPCLKYWECNKKSHMGVFDAHKSLFLSNSCLKSEIYWCVQVRVRCSVESPHTVGLLCLFVLHFILRCYIGTTSASHIDSYTLSKCIHHLILTLTHAKSKLRCWVKDE